MSDVEPFVWRGTVPVQMPSSVAFVSLNQCRHCGALVATNGDWEHEQWHRTLAGEPPIPPLPMRSALEDVMGHIDALYIFLGEKPPYNVGAPVPDRHRPWDFDVDAVCPQCLAICDGMANTEATDPPKDGDVNVCIMCKGISVYDDSVPTKLRFPTDEELEVFSKDPRLQKIRWAMGVVESKLGPPTGKYWPDR